MKSHSKLTSNPLWNPQLLGQTNVRTVSYYLTVSLFSKGPGAFNTFVYSRTRTRIIWYLEPGRHNHESFISYCTHLLSFSVRPQWSTPQASTPFLLRSQTTKPTMLWLWTISLLPLNSLVYLLNCQVYISLGLITDCREVMLSWWSAVYQLEHQLLGLGQHSSARSTVQCWYRSVMGFLISTYLPIGFLKEMRQLKVFRCKK